MRSQKNKSFRASLFAHSTRAVRTISYCSFILFVLNVIFDVPLNEAIPLDAFGILYVGIALFILSTILKIITIHYEYQ